MNAVSTRGGMTPLLQAIAYDQNYMIDRLLASGASAKQDPRYMFDKAASILGGATPLRYALMGNDLRLIQRLFMHGASIEERYAWGQTPLMAAASSSPEIFAELLRRGADPNAVNYQGKTVLLHIVEESPVNNIILRLALEAGARQKATGNLVSPLLVVVYHGDPDSVHLLLTHGANPNERYRLDSGRMPMMFSQGLRLIVGNGGTPLMVAAELGHASVTRTLLASGANREISINADGKRLTALGIARARGNSLVEGILE